MIRVDLTKIPEFLLTRRWFGGKGLPIKTVEVVDHANITAEGQGAAPGEGFILAVIEVAYTVGTRERYLLSVEATPDRLIREGLENDDLARAILRVIRDQRSIPTGTGTLRGEVIGDGGPLAITVASPPVRRISVEQTNTSVVFEEKVILKVIRKLDLGVNPEWEVGRFLAGRGFRSTPRLLGGLHLEGAANTTLAVVHEFVNVESDGWAWVLDQLRSSPTPSAELLAEARRLGERIGELHNVLASDPDDPAFAAEPVLAEDVQRWSSSMIGELGVTVAAASEKVPELAGRREALVERISRIARVEGVGMKIRIHGDLHLGQTLRSGGEWLIFDFEGEPARGYAQRRDKASPLRDVAGMLRSFTYAAATLELEGAPEADRDGPLRREFLAGYRSAASSKLLPVDEETFETVLETLELEKLLYELRYELSHRPDWVRIPARALLAMEAR